MKITNLGLKKPEGTDTVNVQDFNDNADIIEQELLKRPEKDGDAGEMTVQFTEPNELEELKGGDTLKRLFGKLKLTVKNMISVLNLLGTADISTIGDGTVRGAVSAINSNLDKKIGSIKFHLGTSQIKEDTIRSTVTYSLPEGYLHALIIFTTANNFYSMAFISSIGVKTANLIIFNHTSGLYETCSCSINNNGVITFTLENKSNYQKTYGNMAYIYSFK